MWFLRFYTHHLLRQFRKQCTFAITIIIICHIHHHKVRNKSHQHIFIDINNIEVTGGISEALVSTAAGLIVAITSLMFSNYFKIEFQRELPLIQKFLVQFEIARTEKNNQN